MTPEQIQQILTEGEGATVEFKESAERLPRTLFETVCAFLNREGGLILLGVQDDGTVSGVAEDRVEQLKKDIASISNNQNTLDPPYLLFPHEAEIDGKWVISVQVPASSQVHRYRGYVFMRSEDGDYRVQEPNQIAGIVNRKLSFFTEQRVLPHLGLDQLRDDLFEKARTLMRAQNRQHPWLGLSNEQLLHVGGFVKEDPYSGARGYTLATALMFGTDELIQNAVSAYKFDAILRRKDVHRYDDREMIRTNLIDAFDLLMAFVEKHLPDPFYLEGTQRVSLRSRIFRELVSNIIAHREYMSAAPARMIIYQDRVVFENPHVAHGSGPIDPGNFTPYPKNPTICKFMIQIGRFDELGSGVYNVNRYLPLYADGAKPTFEEGTEMFTTVVPLGTATGEVTREVAGEVTREVAGEVTREVERLLNVVSRAMSRTELQEAIGLSAEENFRQKYLVPALEAGLIEMTIPDKPTSRLQKYRLTDKGRAFAHDVS